MKDAMRCLLFNTEIMMIIMVGMSSAAAIERISSTVRTCSELRGIIERQAAVIVTHPGTRASGTLYDRYVRDSASCNPGNVASDDWVPAKDGNCRLLICQPYEPPFDD